MILKRAFLVFLGLFLFTVSIVWAGDSAFFVDLGFSPDGRHYTFAQYGVRTDTLKPWADMFVVDVARNNFVSGGRIAYIHNKPIEAGQDGTGALYHVIAKNAGIVERHNVSYANQGQPLYIALSGDPAYEGTAITFRDFISGIFYQTTLIETIRGTGKDTRSSFYIKLESTDNDGEKKSYTVGTLGLERPGIFSYRIKKVLIDSSGSSLIFVIEMKRWSEQGHDIRYMVEAVRL
ncbi:MAG: DUF2259 domain-containing protein [Treponema sp.]|nr:DUF2259 domain-containing protein [Treponema sp.]